MSEETVDTEILSVESAPPAKERSSDYVVLNFASAERPVFTQVRGDAKYIRYGEDNNYPNYLLELYKTATRHGSIIKGKKTYVAGKGWKVKGDVVDPIAEQFIAKVNRYDESLQCVTDKAIHDLEIFYGAYIQVIWNNNGTGIAELYHLDYTRVRTNKDNTQFYYRESWGSSRVGYNNVEKVFPAFNPKNPKGSQVFFMKVYTPGEGAYPFPEYLRGLDFIESEIEIGKHTNGNAKTGFSASKSITLYVGSDPPDDLKKKVTKDFTNTFTGAGGKKFILNFVTKPENTPNIQDLGASDLTKEDFRAVDELVRENIFSAHEVTTPALFGIATPGALGQRTELRDGYEIFKNTYVNGKQQFVEQHINRLAKYFGVANPLEIIPTDPIGAEPIGRDLLAIKDIVPRSWIYEQLGIDSAKYPDAPAISYDPAVQAMESSTNPILRNLTGRQMQGLERIIRKLKSGTMTDEMARMMLASGYGLTPEEIAAALGTPELGDEMHMSEQLSEDDKAIMVFSEYGRTGEGISILKSKRVKYHDEADAEMREHQYLSFVTAQIDTLEAHILDLINKDKRITPETLSDVLNEDLETINKTLRNLEESGIISRKGDTINVNKKGAELPKPRIKSFRVLYSYDGPQDSRNRPFCARLMELGRFYTRSEIETISQRLGYSVWDRRGGFYHNPVTDETTPYCRHTWMSHVVMEER